MRMFHEMSRDSNSQRSTRLRECCKYRSHCKVKKEPLPIFSNFNRNHTILNYSTNINLVDDGLSVFMFSDRGSWATSTSAWIRGAFLCLLPH